KIKIYYVVNARLPTEKAHGIQIAKMCEAFIEQGMNMELVAPRRGRDFRTLREFYGLRVEVPMTRLWAPDWYGSRMGFAASSLFFAVRYFFYLWRKKKSGERCIIYTTDLDQFSFFLIPFLGVPYFVEMHDAKKKTMPFTLLLNRARGIITINRIIKRELMDVFQLKDGVLLVFPNGVDLAMFRSQESGASARAALGIPESRPVVMYAGRVYAWKGLGVLPAVARKLPDFDFYIVGGTAEEMRAIGAMDEQPKNLICVGHRPFQEIPRWLRAANVLIATGTNANAYSFLHTSPMKLFEYAAAGRPIVAARTPAIEDVFTSRGQNGIFFYEPDSADGLAVAIHAVFMDPETTTEQVETVRDSVSLYQWQYRAEKIQGFIEDRL
ncbi:MAG: glycosyltransferase, partial [Candidatus Sungiibacteriota bacterium]